MRLTANSKLLWTGCFTLSLALHIAAAIYSVGYHHYDEHFQILEFATIKLPFSSGSEADLAWEYTAQIRPAIQPLFVIFVGMAMHHLGSYDPFICVLILQLFSALLGWLSLLLFCKEASLWFSREPPAKIVLAASSLFWIFPYVHARYSSESWSGSLFFLALSLLLMTSRKSRLGTRKGIFRFLFTGLLFGLAFIIRFQTGLMIAGLLTWCIIVTKINWKTLLLMTGGIGIALLTGMIIDTWYYGEWAFTPWNYFKTNIIHDAASNFGVSPWWSYLLWLSQTMLPPFSIIILLAFTYALVGRRSNVLTWIIVPFMIVHLIVPHKELRFLFPLINAAPALLAVTYFDLSARLVIRRSSIALLIGFGIANIFPLLTAAFHPINTDIALYKFIWRNYAKTVEVVQLACNGRNPFDLGVLHINFYKPKNVRVIGEQPNSERYPMVHEPSSGKLLLIHHTLRSDTLSASNTRKMVFKKNGWVLFEVPTQRK